MSTSECQGKSSSMRYRNGTQMGFLCKLHFPGVWWVFCYYTIFLKKEETLQDWVIWKSRPACLVQWNHQNLHDMSVSQKACWIEDIFLEEHSLKLWYHIYQTRKNFNGRNKINLGKLFFGHYRKNCFHANISSEKLTSECIANMWLQLIPWRQLNLHYANQCICQGFITIKWHMNYIFIYFLSNFS